MVPRSAGIESLFQDNARFRGIEGWLVGVFTEFEDGACFEVLGGGGRFAGGCCAWHAEDLIWQGCGSAQDGGRTGDSVGGST